MSESTVLVSVLTPVLATPRKWLLDGYRSLIRQRAEWEWLIQFDGPVEYLPDELERDPRVRPGANLQHSGVAVARNHALARARGSLVLLMDADDYLGPDALAVLGGAMKDKRYGWASGAHLRLEDGCLTVGHGLPPGEVEEGGMVRRWSESVGRRWPHHGATICYRRKALLREGAFVALSRSEDIVTLATFSERNAGVIVDEVTAIRRVHQTSTSHQPENEAMARATYTLLLGVLAARGNPQRPWT